MLAILFHLACLIGTAGLFAATFSLPTYEFGTTGPATFPRLASIVLFGLNGGLLFRALIKKEKIKPALLPNARQAMMVVFLIIYILLLPYIGFIISSLIFATGVSLWLSGEKTGRAIAKACALSLVCVLGIYYVFDVLLMVFLP